MANPRQAPDNPRLSSGSLINHAVQFVVAADAFQVASKGREWFVLYYQFAQAIELALKAFLLENGNTEKSLRRLSHDLEAALKAAELAGLGLELSQQERIALAMLSDFHITAVLRYPQIGGYSIPPASMLRILVDRIVSTVYVRVWGRSRYDYDRQRGTRGLSIDPDIDWDV